MDERASTARRRTGLVQRRLSWITAFWPLAVACAAAPAAAAEVPSLTSGTFFRPAFNISHTPSASSLPRSSPRSLVLDPHGPALLFWVETVPHTQGIAHELALARYIPVAGWDTTLTPIGRWEGNPSTEPACALDPTRTLHLVWLEQRGGNRLVEGLHFRLVTGEMTTTEVISDSTFRAADPAVSADELGHAHVVWTELDGGRSRIAYREWTLEEGWSAIVRLPSVTGASAFGPDVASSASGLTRVVWQETGAAGGRVGYTSRPAGGDWETARFLSPDEPGWYVNDALLAQAPAGERATAVWQAANGKASRIVTCDLADPNAGSPVIVAEGTAAPLTHPAAALEPDGVLHLLWLADSPSGPAVMYDRRSAGEVGGAPRSLTLPGGGPYESPTLATDGAGRVSAVWIDRSVGNGDVLIRSGVSGFAPPLTVRH